MKSEFLKKGRPKCDADLIRKILPNLGCYNKGSATEKRKHFYLSSYPTFLLIARNQALDKETRHMALAAMIYGWMPTIPKSIVPFAIDTVAKIESHDKAYEYLKQKTLKPLINNSWVGTSKMLHFINPQHFPIWDSRIASVVYGDPVDANNKQGYLDYCAAIHQWDIEQPDYGLELAKSIEKEYGYRPTNLRCIELVLFSLKAQSDYQGR